MNSNTLTENIDDDPQNGVSVCTPERIEALKNGNHEAYDQIYLAWHKPIFNLLKKVTGSTEEAEDIMQEVFIYLWEKRGGLDSSKKINAYLFTIAIHATSDYFKRKRATEQYLDAMDWDEISNEASDGKLIEREIQLLTELTLSRMPAYRRNIYTMSHMEGLTAEQIAQRLDITKETVYTQLSIARKQLKDAINLMMIILLMQ